MALRAARRRFRAWARRHSYSFFSSLGTLLQHRLGTLMTVGLMMLPAIAARCWSNRLSVMLLAAVLLGMLSSVIGLAWSWYQSIPAGPAIVLTATAVFLFSVLFGSQKGIFTRSKSMVYSN